jgi:hypothetical protein
VKTREMWKAVTVDDGDTKGYFANESKNSKEG